MFEILGKIFALAIFAILLISNFNFIQEGIVSKMDSNESLIPLYFIYGVLTGIIYLTLFVFTALNVMFGM